MASALEIVPVADGDIAGPKIHVGGQDFEVLQLSLPMFESMDPALEQDFERAAYLQIPVKERLMNMKVDAEMTILKHAEATDVKSKALDKVLRARQVGEYLKKWTAQQRKAMTDDGVSRMELLDALVPSVGSKVCDDPGKKAVKEFLKLHKTMEVFIYN